MINPYIGHEEQLFGVREMRLVGGKGDGMRVLQVTNGCGLVFEISLDRCGDISRLWFKGDNMGYFAPCGYVSPKYYDCVDSGFLKSFTAGFFTTCGLTAVGSPCVDNGESLPLHGTISNIPCERYSYRIDHENIYIELLVRDAAMFHSMLLLKRVYTCSLHKNEIVLTDTIENIGPSETPLEVLYHCNMGYPLLSENAEVTIPSVAVAPRNDHAKEGLENCCVMEKPQNGYTEKCYYHKLCDDVCVSIANADIRKKLSIKYNANELPFFTEWKMMGEVEYVLGLEPGNCLPDGRNEMRRQGILSFLKAGETKQNHIKFEFEEM